MAREVGAGLVRSGLITQKQAPGQRRLCLQARELRLMTGSALPPPRAREGTCEAVLLVRASWRPVAPQAAPYSSRRTLGSALVVVGSLEVEPGRRWRKGRRSVLALEGASRGWSPRGIP